MFGEGLEDGLANPPYRIRDEFETTGAVEALGGDDETDVADIDEVGQRQSEILVLFGNGHDETQIRLDQLGEGFFVTLADAVCQFDFGFGGKADRTFNVLEVLIDQGIFFWQGHVRLRRLSACLDPEKIRGSKEISG